MKKVFGCVGVGIGLLLVIGIISAVIGVKSVDSDGSSVQNNETEPRGESSNGKLTDNSPASGQNKKETRPPSKRAVDPQEIQNKRNAAIGKTFATLTLGDRQFVNAAVEAIVDEGIKLKHESGLGIVKWDQVPEEVQEQWGYDPDAFVKVVEARKKAEEEAARQKKEMAEAARKNQEKEEREKSGNHVGAYVYMKMYVEKNLKSPKSAEFPGPASKFCRPLGDYRYRVDAYVDSQNSFGAQIRTKFSGIIKENVGDDSWTVESLNFIE